MKVKKIMDETTSRYEFNRARKEYLERIGGIHCSYCGYHRGENRTNKTYGSFLFYDSYGQDIKSPNWKLVSKNKKQWMKKPIKIKNRTYQNGEWIEITW
jgi:hypothetical protein